MLLTQESQNKLKKIRESHTYCCITIRSDYDYVWDILLVKAGDDSHKSSIMSGSYEDLNDAVDSIWRQVIKSE